MSLLLLTLSCLFYIFLSIFSHFYIHFLKSTHLPNMSPLPRPSFTSQGPYLVHSDACHLELFSVAFICVHKSFLHDFDLIKTKYQKIHYFSYFKKPKRLPKSHKAFRLSLPLLTSWSTAASPWTAHSRPLRSGTPSELPEWYWKSLRNPLSSDDTASDGCTECTCGHTKQILSISTPLLPFLPFPYTYICWHLVTNGASADLRCCSTNVGLFLAR